MMRGTMPLRSSSCACARFFRYTLAFVAVRARVYKSVHVLWVIRASRVQPSRQGDDDCRDSTSRNCLSDKGLGAGALSLSRLSFGREAGGFAGFRGDACLVLTDGSLQRGQDYCRVSAVG